MIASLGFSVSPVTISQRQNIAKKKLPTLKNLYRTKAWFDCDFELCSQLCRNK